MPGGRRGAHPARGGSARVHPGGALQLCLADYYDQRSAVERVNSRLAGGFGFERPGIRGLAKMQLRVTMALTIMLALALGRIRAGQPEHLRSLVRPA